MEKDDIVHLVEDSDDDAAAAAPPPAERCFGIMRGMESPDRYTMSVDNFKAEALFRCNGWLMQELKAEAAAVAGRLDGKTLALTLAR